jgi:serine/threonine-protein kinase
VILRCLEQDRGLRYESIGELAPALLPFAPSRSKVSVERISGVLRAAGLSESALALPPSSDHEMQSGAVGTAASWGKTASPRGRAPWVLVGGLGLSLATAGLVWSLAQGTSSVPASAAGLGAEHALPSVRVSAAVVAPASPPPSAAASSAQPGPATASAALPVEVAPSAFAASLGARTSKSAGPAARSKHPPAPARAHTQVDPAPVTTQPVPALHAARELAERPLLAAPPVQAPLTPSGSDSKIFDDRK